MDESPFPSLDLTNPDRQTDLLKALANPVRLQLLKHLAQGPSCVTLSCLRLGIPQPNLSKHLQILKDSGLIDCRGKGSRHCYFICRPALVKPLLKLFENQYPYRSCTKPEQKEI